MGIGVVYSLKPVLELIVDHLQIQMLLLWEVAQVLRLFYLGQAFLASCSLCHHGLEKMLEWQRQELMACLKTGPGMPWESGWLALVLGQPCTGRTGHSSQPCHLVEKMLPVLGSGSTQPAVWPPLVT